jgi:hypothetical protein
MLRLDQDTLAFMLSANALAIEPSPNEPRSFPFPSAATPAPLAAQGKLRTCQ